ncbi:MAG: Bacterial alpha-L-rhamnosidase [candidate division BRC1 bacterium ADurb.BinA364]|nr:MAG: Bacterial alpha-L-rhamnosidase [candidate division BRC1 bacterium ADurb.BinA364]
MKSMIKLWRGNCPDEARPNRWNARWIWRRGECAGTNLYLLLRRAFRIEGAKAARARLYIAADSSYRLWVNGQFVCRGPARCAPQRQAFDILDLAPLLRPGRNILAVLAHHNGAATPQHNLGRPGFLAQLEIEDKAGAREILSGETWLASPGHAWRRNAPRETQNDGGAGRDLAQGAPMPPPRFGRGFTEILDMRRMPRGWESLDFDDSDWERAAVVPQPYGWPTRSEAPGAIVRPWTALEARDIPWLDETPARAARLHRADEVVEYAKLSGLGDDPALCLAQDIHAPLRHARVEGEAAWREGTGPLVLVPAPATDAFILKYGIRGIRAVLDLGDGMNGHARLEIEGPRGAVVDIAYAPHLVGGEIAFTLMNTRNADRLILSGERDVWEAINWRYFRYLALTARAADGPIKIHWAGMTRIGYPFEERGAFESSDRRLDALWRAGAKTVRIVTSDAFQDNYREQLQYHQTGYYSARANWAAFGDPHLQRRLLIQGAQAQFAEGLMPPMHPGVLPDKNPSCIIESNLFYVMAWRDYWLRSGDGETARRLAPVVERALSRFAELENDEGAIEDPPYEYWIDHAPLDRCGANLCFNAFYIMALENAAQAFEWLGAGDPAALLARAERTRRFLRRRLFDSRRGVFADALAGGRRSAVVSEHANAIALHCAIAAPKAVPAIAQWLAGSPRGDAVAVSPLFMFYMAEGLFRAGEGAQAIRLLKRRFGPMLDSDYGTLWEDWALIARKSSGAWRPAARCLAQAESAFPPDTLGRWALGVWPQTPGIGLARIRYSECGLKKIGGRVPAPQGNIEVEWSVSAKRRRLRLCLPPGVRGELDIASMKARHGWRPRLDGSSVDAGQWPAARPSAPDGGFVALDSGEHEIAAEIE